MAVHDQGWVEVSGFCNGKKHAASKNCVVRGSSKEECMDLWVLAESRARQISGPNFTTSVEFAVMSRTLYSTCGARSTQEIHLQSKGRAMQEFDNTRLCTG